MIFNKLLNDPKEVTQKVIELLDRNEILLLTYLNQHCYNIYCKNKDYKELLDKKFKVYQADVGVFLTQKFIFNKKVNRIDGTTLNREILNELIILKTPLTIIGGKFDENFIQEESNRRGINLVAYQNGYFEEDQTQSVIRYLNGYKERVFLIGMGVPRQEYFAERLMENSDSKIIICVGNFLEFYFGTKRRAPLFIRKVGLEWVFRLFTEPARLWKRYIIGIPEFMFRIFKLKFKRESL